MMQQTSQALSQLTQVYCQAWQQQTGDWPSSRELLGIDSPCILRETPDKLFWQPRPFSLSANLAAVERGVEIRLQASVVAFYTTQFAGDLHLTYQGEKITLLQAWSAEDFDRLQHNLIGHLVMKRGLKQTPTLFIGTTEEESEVIAVDNLSGEVIREIPGTKQRQQLATDLATFLTQLAPRLDLSSAI